VKIIWDEPKRLSNLVKHGLDFADIEDGYDFDSAIVLPAKPSRTGLARFRLIGELHGAVLVAIRLDLGKRGYFDRQSSSGESKGTRTS
jgi:hypothetical protein